MSDKNKWFSLFRALATIIIPTVEPKLAPIVAPIIQGSIDIEGTLGDGTGPDKLAHVQSLANDTADAINAAKGREAVDKTNLNDAVAGALKTAVAVTNLVAGKKDVITGSANTGGTNSSPLRPSEDTSGEYTPFGS